MLIAMVLTTLAWIAGDATSDGTAWIGKTEARLYSWPKPGSLVRFQVRTNLLDAKIAELEKDPETAADPDKTRWVDALKHVTIRGEVDTATGKVTSEIVLRYEPSNPKGKAASAKTKAWLSSAIAGVFQGLPLQDPSMLRKGGTVIGSYHPYVSGSGWSIHTEPYGGYARPEEIEFTTCVCEEDAA